MVVVQLGFLRFRLTRVLKIRMSELRTTLWQFAGKTIMNLVQLHLASTMLELKL